MSQPCAITNCKRASRTLCHCCNQNLCRDHFNEHDDLLNSQLNPLTDQINELADRLTAINIDRITNESRYKLNQWRIDCHQIIDRFYEKKCQEFDRYVTGNIDKQRREIADVRSKMTELIEKQETTNNDIDTLTSVIRNLEEKMNEIEHIHVEVDILPLVIDDSSIQIRKSKVHQFDLISLQSAYRTIERGFESWNVLASNDRCLLMHIDSNLCLIREDLSVVKQKKWNHGVIKEMCWSSVLGGFIVTTGRDVLLVNGNTLSIERVQQIEDDKWWSCGCSDKSLYLSRDAWDSSIFEYSLLPSIRFVKLWKTADKIKREQRVDAIVYKHGTLALVINDRSIEAKLIELRSVETFSPLWSIQLDVNYNSKVIHCCLLNHDEWLLADWFTSRLFHVSNEGKLKGTDTYQSVPCNMNLFRSKILVILARVSVNFYKL
jgi:hypothetical protein